MTKDQLKEQINKLYRHQKNLEAEQRKVGLQLKAKRKEYTMLKSKEKESKTDVNHKLRKENKFLKGVFSTVMLNAGTPIGDIAKLLKCHETTVMRHLRDHEESKR